MTRKPLQKKNIALLAKKFKFTEQQCADMIGVSYRSYRKMGSAYTLSVPATEMVVKLSELFEIGTNTFDGDTVSLANWMNRKTIALNNYAPSQLIGTLTGMDMVKSMLWRMEYSIPE